jgi:hypothetical protein
MAALSRLELNIDRRTGMERSDAGKAEKAWRKEKWQTQGNGFARLDGSQPGLICRQSHIGFVPPTIVGAVTVSRLGSDTRAHAFFAADLGRPFGLLLPKCWICRIRWTIRPHSLMLTFCVGDLLFNWATFRRRSLLAISLYLNDLCGQLLLLSGELADRLANLTQKLLLSLGGYTLFPQIRFKLLRCDRLNLTTAICDLWPDQNLLSCGRP